MNILIVGASGLVGSHLADQCDKRSSWKSIGTFFGTSERNFLPLDITNVESVQEIFKNTQPQVVFLTAFNPNVDYCEEHPKEAEITNIVGNKNIIDMSSQYNAKVVYFSSDFVFDGINGPYKENDQPSPICVYGKQKLAIERYIENNLRNYLIVRTTIVYGWEKREKNFFCQVLNHLRNNRYLNVPIDQIGTPTLAEDLAESCCQLVENEATGLVHVTGPDRLSRLEFAEHIAQEFSLPKHLLHATPTDELAQKAKRPLSVGLTSNRLKQLIPYRMRGVKEGLVYLHEHGRTSPNILSTKN